MWITGGGRIIHSAGGSRRTVSKIVIFGRPGFSTAHMARDLLWIEKLSIALDRVSSGSETGRPSSTGRGGKARPSARSVLREPPCL
jgi:hypothetical protein